MHYIEVLSKSTPAVHMYSMNGWEHKESQDLIMQSGFKIVDKDSLHSSCRHTDWLMGETSVLSRGGDRAQQLSGKEVEILQELGEECARNGFSFMVGTISYPGLTLFDTWPWKIWISRLGGNLEKLWKNIVTCNIFCK